jgi:hypothetical protein
MKPRLQKAFQLYSDSPDLQRMKWDRAASELNVGYSTIGIFRRKLGLTRTASLKKRIADLLADEDFGVPYNHAPVPANVIAERHGLSPSMVQRQRKQRNIEPHIRRYKRRPDDDKFYKRVQSKEEKEIMDLCSKTKAWGRPKGIDKHLESLSD